MYGLQICVSVELIYLGSSTNDGAAVNIQSDCYASNVVVVR